MVAWKYMSINTSSSTIIPWACQTKSKINLSKKITFQRGDGAYLYDAENNEYTDFDCSKGAVILGHAFSYIDNKIIKVIKDGILFPTASYIEFEAADRLLTNYRGMNWVRFLTSGVSVNSAACRIARKLTLRNSIIYFSYAGWMDIFTPGESENSIYLNINESNLFSTLESCIDDVAAILIPGWEPIDFYQEKLKRIVSMAKNHGAIIILDNISLGLRIDYEKRFVNIDPDILTIGKSIANGYPSSAILGKKQCRKPVDDMCAVFSETHAGNRIGIAGIKETLEFYNTNRVYEYINLLVDKLYDKVIKLQQQYNFFRIHRFDAIIFIDWFSQSNKKYVFEYLLRLKIIYSDYLHLTLSHTQYDIDKLIDCLELAIKSRILEGVDET